MPFADFLPASSMKKTPNGNIIGAKHHKNKNRIILIAKPEVWTKISKGELMRFQACELHAIVRIQDRQCSYILDV